VKVINHFQFSGTGNVTAHKLITHYINLMFPTRFQLIISVIISSIMTCLSYLKINKGPSCCFWMQVIVEQVDCKDCKIFLVLYIHKWNITVI